MSSSLDISKPPVFEDTKTREAKEKLLNEAHIESMKKIAVELKELLDIKR